MNAYLGCCCDVPAPTCENQNTGYPCGPVAIVVEGYAIQTKEGSNSESSYQVCECVSCPDSNVVSNPRDNTITLEENGSSFVRVQFKALLIRNGEATYQTFPGGQFTPVASIIGAFESRSEYSEIFIGDSSSCPGTISPVDSCNFRTRSLYSRVIERSTGNEEYQLTSFSLSRQVQFFDCNQITPCAEGGCYEIFSLNSEWSVAAEASGLATDYFEYHLYNGFLNECELIIGRDFGLTCSESTEVTSSFGINQYSLILPQEPNVCPKANQRPISFTIDSSSYKAPPNPSCSIFTTCECQDAKGILLHTYGIRGDNLTLNQIHPPVTLQCIGTNWGYGTANAWSNDCAGFHIGNGGTNSFDVSDSASSVSCSEDGNPTCMATVQCGQPRPFNRPCPALSPGYPGVGNAEIQGSLSGSCGAELVLTRHELLYQLPDPANWPQNV